MASRGDGDGGGRRPRAVFMAFGTQGDVFPIAALAAAFAREQPQYAVVFITHSAHRSFSAHLAASNVRYMPVSSPPVLAARQVENILCGSQSNHEDESFSSQKKIIQTEHRKECLSCVEDVFGDDPSIKGDFIVINFFALVSTGMFMYQLELEGWHLAELFQVKCIIAAPYFVPYSAPSSFERQFKHNFPQMYNYFQEAPSNTVQNDLSQQRFYILNHFSLWDPVTNLPLWHVREQSPLLLYGFSKEIVEYPGYWPSSAHACGFCMGFLRNPKAFLMVLKAAIESTDYRFILFSSGYQPLDSAIQSIASSVTNASEASSLGDDSALLFNGRLFCFSGSIPYSWLFPRCAAAIHHAGSGSTAAALRAGIPQVLCPFLLDQFYWAERLHWLGVAPEPLQRQHLIPDNDDALSIHNAADVLLGAIRSVLLPEIKDQATIIANRLSFEDGIGEALRILKERVLIDDKIRAVITV
nr:unnamed protein product [Digitaria exilis]